MNHRKCNINYSISTLVDAKFVLLEGNSFMRDIMAYIDVSDLI